MAVIVAQRVTACARGAKLAAQQLPLGRMIGPASPNQTNCQSDNTSLCKQHADVR